MPEKNKYGRYNVQVAYQRALGAYGTPYSNDIIVPGKNGGMDCSGFITYIFDINPRLSTATMPNRMPNYGFKTYRFGEVSLQKGDVLCWVNPNPAEMGHTTWYIKGAPGAKGLILHSTTPGGVQWGSTLGLSTSNTYIFRPLQGWGFYPIKWDGD